MKAAKAMRAALISIAILLAIPSVYFLSTGPAVYLWCRGIVPDEAWDTVYAPVFVLCKKSKTFNYYISAYMDWWEVQAKRGRAAH
jgi:hypothetical protein